MAIFRGSTTNHRHDRKLRAVVMSSIFVFSTLFLLIIVKIHYVWVPTNGANAHSRFREVRPRGVEAGDSVKAKHVHTYKRTHTHTA